MPDVQTSEPIGPENRTRPDEESDASAVRRLVFGDPTGLRLLMDRYDRLVRYTVFQRAQHRCRKDPEWLDSVASATWAGFVQSLNRSPESPPSVISAYLVRIARNQVASSLRKKELPFESTQSRDIETVAGDSEEASDPLTTLLAAEDLTSLKACMENVGGDERELLVQLEAITERRWRDAAEALGLPESTLRSRWQRLLDRLRECMEGKTGKSFAPDAAGGD